MLSSNDNESGKMPDPVYINIAAGLLRTLLAAMAGIGFGWAAGVTGEQTTMLATFLVVAATAAWSSWQKLAAYRTRKAAAVESAIRSANATVQAGQAVAVPVINPPKGKADMNAVRLPLIAAIMLGLAACTAADEAAIGASADKIEEKIVKACTASGLFKTATTVALAAVPAGTLPKAAIDAGVDLVCGDPAKYAKDAGTVAWVAKNLRDIVAAR